MNKGLQKQTGKETGKRYAFPKQRDVRLLGKARKVNRRRGGESSLRYIKPAGPGNGKDRKNGLFNNRPLRLKKGKTREERKDKKGKREDGSLF